MELRQVNTQKGQLPTPKRILCSFWELGLFGSWEFLPFRSTAADEFAIIKVSG